MSRTNFKELLDAGVHFGHLKRKWNPAMAPYIFMERNGIHIIDLHKTSAKIDEACSAMKQITRSGRKILFVATKKQAKEIVSETIKKIGMPYVTERWPGGMLTNFPTIRKAVKKMATIDKMSSDGTYDNLSKREKLQIQRQRSKLEKNLGSIADLTRLPAALFVVDVTKENIAVREANRLNIPVFGIVDTNSNPNNIDFVIPANDDASKSIALIIEIVARAVEEGLSERMAEKEKEGDGKDKKTRTRKERKEDKAEPARAKTLVKKTEPVEKKEEKETISEEKPEKSYTEKPEERPEEIKEEKKEKEIKPAKKTAPKKAPAKKSPAKKSVAKKEVKKNVKKNPEPEISGEKEDK